MIESIGVKNMISIQKRKKNTGIEIISITLLTNTGTLNSITEKHVVILQQVPPEIIKNLNIENHMSPNLRNINHMIRKEGMNLYLLIERKKNHTTDTEVPFCGSREDSQSTYNFYKIIAFFSLIELSLHYRVFEMFVF